MRNQRQKVCRNLTFFAVCVLSTVWGGVGFGVPVAAFAEEFAPQSAWTNAEILVRPNDEYALERLFDGDPNASAVLLDASRDGDRSTTLPPNGSAPVSARIVFDLGSEREIAGVRFVSPPTWKVLGPKKIDVFASSDAQGTADVRVLRENVELLPINYGCSVPVSWEKTTCRYLGVDVRDAWQIRDHRQGLSDDDVFAINLAEVKILTEAPDDPVVPNAPEVAFPKARLLVDWLMQDVGIDGAKRAFLSADDAGLEKAALSRVLDELQSAVDEENPTVDADSLASLRRERDALADANVPGADERWKSLYVAACEKRRAVRLSVVFETTDKILYVKRFVHGSSETLSINPNGTDRQYRGTTSEERGGSQLCLLTLREDGTYKHEVLLDRPNGVIRDPNLSWDAKTVFFAATDNWREEDYSLYKMDFDSKKITRLTTPPKGSDGTSFPCADLEPCVTPSGDLVFTSNRNSQIDDCWPQECTNLYTCRPDGTGVRRLTYDELDVYGPQVLNDGRIVFTRWEYNDRNAYFLHPLFTMNQDGTAQTEYVGNNSTYPSSYLQARPIPGSDKLIGIISGHHVPGKGKLALIDRTLGTQNGDCIEFVAGSSPDGTPGRKKNYIKAEGFCDLSVDYFGQNGPQYQYPFAFDEDHYLTAFAPEGWSDQFGPYYPPFGLYFMDADGRRELLAFDWQISCSQPIAVVEREIPAVKPSQVVPEANFGTFVVQDVYIGPGLKGIERGTVEKLRVVALEYRAAWCGTGANAGEADSGYVQTPISLNNGAWDVKHVLGEVDIEADGSCAFSVPARTPVYFQLLDKNGYCVQTMRSWSTLQGGETFACLGCHEDKLETGAMEESRPTPIALTKAPQRLKPSFGVAHPLVERLETESALDSVENYLGVNSSSRLLIDAAGNFDESAASNADGTTRGFSYVDRIQPILDKHCVSCHSGDGENRSEPNLSGEIVELDLSDPRILLPWIYERIASEGYVNGVPTPYCVDWKRDFTKSYLELTNFGKLKGSRWVRWLEVRSRSEILPPYHTGSSQSPLMKYLEPDHYDVQVSENEKRAVACWIDLLIPFCGSYLDANRWNDGDKATWKYYFDKRIFFAEREMEELKNAR